MELMSSHPSQMAATEPSSMSPTADARRADAGLRPEGAHHTGCSPARTPPTAPPISPVGRGVRPFEPEGNTQPMATPKGLAPTPIGVSTVLVAKLIGVTVSSPAVLAYAVVPLGVMAMPNG